MKPLAQRIVLLVLFLGILVVESGPRLLRLVKPEELPSPTSRNPHLALSAAAEILTVETARLGIEDRVSRPARNVFAFADIPRHQPDGGQKALEPDLGPSPDPGQRQEQRPRETSPDVALVGVFGPERLRIAVIKDNRASRISNVLEEDVVREGYVVERIELRSIELRKPSWDEAAPVRLEIGGSMPP